MEEFDVLSKIIKNLYNIDEEVLLSKSRKRELVELRYICANILRSETEYGTIEIGEVIGIDHSTICHAAKVHENLYNAKSQRNYTERYKSICDEYHVKMQTPDKLIEQLEILKQKRGDIETKIYTIEEILKKKQEELLLEQLN